MYADHWLSFRSVDRVFQLVEQGDETAETSKQIQINKGDRLLEKIAKMKKSTVLLAHKIEGFQDFILELEKDIEIKDE